tara:strand:- start:759 stop:995 length:237 start_codon:yes stop_codon:yes gene_type:complete
MEEITYVLMRRYKEHDFGDEYWRPIGKELKTKGLVLGALKKGYAWENLRPEMVKNAQDFKWVKNTKTVVSEDEIFKLI